MISITDKKDCCGCEACSQICPKNCISMQPDEEGFYYPVVDNTKCIECGLCEKTCPIINKKEPRKPKSIYAGINSDEEIRENSSSGGVFWHIAEQVIDQGGIVVGAVFNEKWEVFHDFAETKEELTKMRGSKYVQSRLPEVYRKIKKLLNDERLVLFSGTSCQVSALLLFLRKKYDNLLTVELICAGVPSPGLWKQYLQEEVYPAALRAETGKNTVPSLKEIPALAGISFRDKITGWKKFSLVVRKESTSKADKNSVLLSDIHYEHPYFYGFHRRAAQRYSCYECPARGGSSQSDIILGDFWSYENDDIIQDDDRGISLILVNSEKGEAYLKGLTLTRRSYEEIKRKNPASVKSAYKSVYRENFYSDIKKRGVKKQMKFLYNRLRIRNTFNKVFQKIGLSLRLKY